MKNFYLLLLSGLLLVHPQAGYPVDWINDADEITEEWLVDAGTATGYTEHVRHFKQLFNQMQVRTFLEFGLGFSTKYFMDHSDKVISVEFVTPGTGPEWMKFCLHLFRNKQNWIPIAYFAGEGLDTSWAPNKYMGAESVYKAAAYQPVHCASYAPIDPSFLVDLTHFIDLQVSQNPIDVAFVDCGVCLRGDLVQILFNRVPVIVAHDIAPRSKRMLSDVYGYGRVVAPENYEEIHIIKGMGTAFWVKKDPQYKKLIAVLKAYALKK